MSLSDRDYDEKRNFIRMEITAPTEVEVSRENGISMAGACKNLSGGGVQVTLEEPLTEGETVSVKIASEHGHKPMLQAKAKVVRSKPEGDKYRIGLEIEELL